MTAKIIKYIFCKQKICLERKRCRMCLCVLCLYAMRCVLTVSPDHQVHVDFVSIYLLWLLLSRRIVVLSYFFWQISRRRVSHTLKQEEKKKKKTWNEMAVCWNVRWYVKQHHRFEPNLSIFFHFYDATYCDSTHTLNYTQLMKLNYLIELENAY